MRTKFNKEKLKMGEGEVDVEEPLTHHAPDRARLGVEVDVEAPLTHHAPDRARSGP